MYYSYVEIEYVATSFSPARTDLALKLLTLVDYQVPIQFKVKHLRVCDVLAHFFYREEELFLLSRRVLAILVDRVRLHGP
jgi:hypothetical protein